MNGARKEIQDRHLGWGNIFKNGKEIGWINYDSTHRAYTYNSKGSRYVYIVYSDGKLGIRWK